LSNTEDEFSEATPPPSSLKFIVVPNVIDEWHIIGQKEMYVVFARKSTGCIH